MEEGGDGTDEEVVVEGPDLHTDVGEAGGGRGEGTGEGSPAGAGGTGAGAPTVAGGGTGVGGKDLHKW